jgi:succinoglycan biosynthesis transport protein ExoP
MLRILNRKPTGAIAQSARRLMNNVDMRAGDHARSIVIAGAGPGTAKSSIALMLGWAAMQSGRTCIVVDTDLRQARLSTALRLIDRTGRTNRATLVDVLYQVATLDQAVQSLEPSGLRVLACTPTGTEPSLLFNTARAKSIVEDLLNRYDIVIFDTSPLTDTSDAFTLPMLFDVGLFVAESGKTLFTQVETGLEVLSETDLGNTGAVLANTRRAIGS